MIQTAVIAAAVWLVLTTITGIAAYIGWTVTYRHAQRNIARQAEARQHERIP